MFLKNKYGSGYNLVITTSSIDASKSEEAGRKESDLSCQETSYSQMITQLIQSIIPNAKLNSCINSEISFVLPKEDSFRFSELFGQLDAKKLELGLLNVGISVTTVEEVFLK